MVEWEHILVNNFKIYAIHGQKTIPLIFGGIIFNVAIPPKGLGKSGRD